MWQPFEELADVTTQHLDDPVDDRFNIHGNCGGERVGAGESVGEVSNDGVLDQCRCIGSDGGYGDHVGGIADQGAGVTVVRVVVVGSVSQHKVWCLVTNQADQVEPILQCGFQASVGVIQDMVRDPQRGTGRIRFHAADVGQAISGDLVMPGASVGHADEGDCVAQLAPECGRAAGRKVAVVGMGADDQYL